MRRARHEAAATSGRAGSLVEIRMLQALAPDAQGHRPQALQTLGEAWAQAPEPDGYVRLFLDEGAPMVELLRDAERQGPAGDHARRMLSLSPARDGDAAGAGGPVPPSAEVLTERELQALRLLASELSGPQIAASCSSRTTRFAPIPGTSSPSSRSPPAGLLSAAHANAA